MTRSSTRRSRIPADLVVAGHARARRVRALHRADRLPRRCCGGAVSGPDGALHMSRRRCLPRCDSRRSCVRWTSHRRRCRRSGSRWISRDRPTAPVTVVRSSSGWPKRSRARAAHFNVPEYRQYLIDDARERVQALVAEEPRTWTAIQDVVVLGRAHREILRIAADSRIDLIVMGVAGARGPWPRALRIDDAASRTCSGMSRPDGPGAGPRSPDNDDPA